MGVPVACWRTGDAEREIADRVEGRLIRVPIGAKKDPCKEPSQTRPRLTCGVPQLPKAGLTLYRIAKDTGVVKSSLMRFMRGETTLRLDRVDTLADYLGFELVKRTGT